MATTSFTEIRRIDNSRLFMPLLTTVLVIFIILISIWFFRGGSFRLYASVFFTLYNLTGQVWISVLLIGIVQNVVFLPMRFIGLKLSTSLHAFEDELEKQKSEEQQYFLFTQQVKRGNPAIIFFIFSFIVNAIAFFSAGRIFLIDFYAQKLNPHYLYSFVKYPDYPLLGTDFHFPFIKITQTYSLPWNQIFTIWGYVLIALIVPRLIWRLVKFIFWKNQRILSARINYNRIILKFMGFAGTLFILSLFFLRNIPTSFQTLTLVADLTRQNTTMNFITAVGTFITALHAGYTRERIAAKKALAAGIDKEIIKRATRTNIRMSFRNAIVLGAGAFLVTNQIPCAFELSVATFEVLYILSPYTFDRILVGVSNSVKPQNEPVAPTT
ncbi:MAG TPA: hypothetical protein PK370_02810 [Candidatus Woesebacteria bacterium]|nr:hypothetical protein [Candidatus Woesebacteria bacterium]HPJ16644.1 hypothetical protein [Candidatus Woesebacteria bacterium]